MNDWLWVQVDEWIDGRIRGGMGRWIDGYMCEQIGGGVSGHVDRWKVG